MYGYPNIGKVKSMRTFVQTLGYTTGVEININMRKYVKKMID